MTTPGKRTMSVPLIAGLAVVVIVLCVAGIAALMGWIPGSPSATAPDRPTPESQATSAPPPDGIATAISPTQFAPRETAKPPPQNQAYCPTCGMIETIREIKLPAKPGSSNAGFTYAVKILLENGTTRVIYYPEPPELREGDRIKFDKGRLEPNE